MLVVVRFAVPEWDGEAFASLVQAALSVLGILGPDAAIALLRQRSATLEAQLAAQRAALAEYGREIPRFFLIESEYELALRTAEADWLRGIVAELRDGSFTGVAQWRAFHETGYMPPELAAMAERGRLTE